MRFSIITAFPEFFREFLSSSVVGRGLKAGLFEVRVVDLRSFGKGAYRQIDDYAFGSGGMVLAAEPLKNAVNALMAEGKERETPFVVYPTPQGTPLTQEVVETLFHQGHVAIVCGHYEGIDERFILREVDLEVAVGDCVLTGGEIPAMAIVDAVSRLIPGVVGKRGAVEEDSFFRGMLDHPHYTRPASWDGEDVPEALISGDAAEIRDWRRRETVTRTLSRRPDLLSRSGLAGYMRGGFYLAVEHDEKYSPDCLKESAELCESYGAARLFLIVKEPSGRDALRRALELGYAGGPKKLKLMPSLERTLDLVREKENRALLVEVADEIGKGARHWLEMKRFILEKDESALFYFPVREHGNESLDLCCFSMMPLQGGSLSLYGKVAAVLDRFLGSK